MSKKINKLFLDSLHEEKYKEFTKKAEVHPEDVERIALFYVISGFNVLCEHVNDIYDFEEKLIKSTEVFEQDWITSSSKALIKLAYNMFNGYKEDADLMSVFSYLDERNIELAFRAIHIRVRRGFKELS